MTTILKDGESFCKIINGALVKVDSQGNEIVEDGQVMHVPFFMDSASKPGTQAAPIVNADHARPRYGVMTQAQQAQSVASHHKMVERVSDAWRNPTLPPQQDSNPAPAPAAAPVADAGAAYDRMRKRQEDAWKTAKTK